MYTTRKPDELAELLGLSVKQEELLPTSSTLEDAWVREQGDVKEGENQENVFASENTEGPCEALAGGEEVEEERVKESELNSKTIKESELENKKVKESELENKRSNDHENKAKLSSSDLNKIHSTDFFDAFLGENVEESGDKREMTIEKGKDEGVLVTNFEKKMFSRRRCHGYKVKKEGRTEAEVDGQYKIESESVGSSEETRKRGKPLDWQHVECFDSPQGFNRSQIKAELDEVMTRRKSWRTSEARQEGYVCKFGLKQAWKPCLRQYRVSLHYQCAWHQLVSGDVLEHQL